MQANGTDSMSTDTERQEPPLKQITDRWTVFFGEGGYVWEKIDPGRAVWSLAMWCFLTGYMFVIQSILNEEKLAYMNILMI